VAANAAANGVGGRVRAVTGPLESAVGADGPFAVTVANMLLPVLAELAPAIEKVTGSWLVLSGMLDGTQERAEALFPNWHVVRRTTLDGWAGCLLSRARFLAEPNEDLP
jgi:ribosomal protein L11 methylase PrmA